MTIDAHGEDEGADGEAVDGEIGRVPRTANAQQSGQGGPATKQTSGQRGDLVLGLVELVLAEQSSGEEGLQGSKERHERNDEKPVAHVREGLQMAYNGLIVTVVDDLMVVAVQIEVVASSGHGSASERSGQKKREGGLHDDSQGLKYAEEVSKITNTQIERVSRGAKEICDVPESKWNCFDAPTTPICPPSPVKLSTSIACGC